MTKIIQPASPCCSGIGQFHLEKNARDPRTFQTPGLAKIRGLALNPLSVEKATLANGCNHCEGLKKSDPVTDDTTSQINPQEGNFKRKLRQWIKALIEILHYKNLITFRTACRLVKFMGVTHD